MLRSTSSWRDGVIIWAARSMRMRRRVRCFVHVLRFLRTWVQRFNRRPVPSAIATGTLHPRLPCFLPFRQRRDWRRNLAGEIAHCPQSQSARMSPSPMLLVSTTVAARFGRVHTSTASCIVNEASAKYGACHRVRSKYTTSSYIPYESTNSVHSTRTPSSVLCTLVLSTRDEHKGK